MRLTFKHISTCVLLLLTFASCFKEEEAFPAISLITIDDRIYTNFVYFNCEDSSVTATVDINEWDLAFDTDANGWQVVTNISKNIYVSTDFTGTLTDVYTLSGDEHWEYEKPQGIADSVLLNGWITNNDPSIPSGKVFLLSVFDGLAYQPFKKLEILSVNEESYQIAYSDYGATISDTTTIFKDANYIRVYVNLQTKETVHVEPPRDDWDFVFLPYTDMVPYSDSSGFERYPVRGVFLHPENTVAVINNQNFFNITRSMVLDYSFSDIQNTIGYDWKFYDLEINQYAVRRNINFVIKTPEENYFKLRFMSYTNADKTPSWGYPAFELGAF